MLGPDDLTHSDDIESELQEIRGALFDDKIGVLGPAEAICLRETATVSEAIERMLARRQAGVLIVDGDGRLTGIFTERDVLTRVAGPRRDPQKTPLAEVMTRDPEALTAGDRIAFAVHCMSVAGYRTVPLVQRRPAPHRRGHRERRHPLAGGAVSRGRAQPAAGRRAQAPPPHGCGLTASILDPAVTLR